MSSRNARQRMRGEVGFSALQPESPAHGGDWWAFRVSPHEVDHPLFHAWAEDDFPKLPGKQYAAYCRELDAWTEYWDIYHPETHGRYYFGSAGHPGYLNQFLSNPMTGHRSPVFESWKAMVLWSGDEARFHEAMQPPEVVEAVLAVDDLVRRIARDHFGDDHLAYLDAMERFGRDTLPPSPERFALIPEDDGRKSTSLHHTIEGDIMWFGWAIHLECAQRLGPPDPIRALLMAGVALGVSFDYAYRRGYRTRVEYQSKDQEAWRRIWERALGCVSDFDAGAREVRQLFLIREYGDESAC